MARKRIGMKKIREIIRFRETTDMSVRRIARALNISRPVVAQYIRDFNASGLTYEQIKDMADSRLLALFEKQKNRKCSKYEKLSRQFPYVAIELKKTGVTLMTLWNEYQKGHPDGYSYSQFCYHFQVWRSASKVTMHIEHKAGDKIFVDYAGDKLTIVDRKTGKEQPVEVFVLQFRHYKRPRPFCSATKAAMVVTHTHRYMSLTMLEAHYGIASFGTHGAVLSG